MPPPEFLKSRSPPAVLILRFPAAGFSLYAAIGGSDLDTAARILRIQSFAFGRPDLNRAARSLRRHVAAGRVNPDVAARINASTAPLTLPKWIVPLEVLAATAPAASSTRMLPRISTLRFSPALLYADRSAGGPRYQIASCLLNGDTPTRINRLNAGL